MKFNPATLGVIVAEVAFVYDPLRIADCQEYIVGVIVVNEHVGGGFAATVSTHVHAAVD